MPSVVFRRAGLIGALLASLMSGLSVPSSADSATVSSAVRAGGPSEPDVLGDVHGPAPAIATTPDPARSGRVTLAAAPRPTRSLPAQLDAQPSYVGQTSCDPFAKPGAVALGDLLLASYRTGSYGVSRLCHLDGTSEHLEGRALDWMLSAANPAQHAVATSALAWLTDNSGANARRLGVMYLIYNRKMWRAYDPGRRWADYHGASPHTDHIHISLTWDGAMKRTSWWTGTPVVAQDRGPCRVYAGEYAPLYRAANYRSCSTSLPAAPTSRYAVYTYGQKGDPVAVAQRILGVTADGSFGSRTRDVLLSWQPARGLPRTGVLDKATWARMVPGVQPAPASPPTPRSATVTPPGAVMTALTPYKRTRLASGSRGPAVAALQRALAVRGESRYRSRTIAAVRAIQRAARLRVTGVTDARTWNRIEERAYPWVGYRYVVLRRGSRGPAVAALQRALGATRDGVFGPVTERALRSLQARFGLPQTGVTDLRTWLSAILTASR
ncbi:MAG TPA: peptidoglycan-binding protein [Dermatophilaceae bacterium]|nr:peptidoglycan-binding protein [Dermatophilaceae bacterium]